MSLAMWISGCSGDAEDSRAAVPANYFASGRVVCSLLRQGELEAVLGHRYRAGEPVESIMSPAFEPLPGMVKCVYGAAERGVAPPQTGVVYAYAGQLFRQKRRESEALNRQTPTSGAAIVGTRTANGLMGIDGVGEEAFWSPVAGELFVLEDRKIVGVHLAGESLESPGETIERARRLADIALRRIRRLEAR